MLPILQNNNVLTMTSREITELVNSRHADVCKSIDKLSEKGVISRYTAQPYTSDQNGQTYYEYYISKRDSYVIVAQFSPEFTAKLVDRWQELENEKKLALPDFNNPVEAARAWADAKESEIKAIEYAEAARPAVEFVERYVESTGNMGFRQVAKLLKAKENDFRAFLQDNSVMYRLGNNWVAYQRHTDAGRFHVSTGTSKSKHVFNEAKFTPKGVEWIAKLWSEK